MNLDLLILGNLRLWEAMNEQDERFRYVDLQIVDLGLPFNKRKC